MLNISFRNVIQWGSINAQDSDTQETIVLLVSFPLIYKLFMTPVSGLRNAYGLNYLSGTTISSTVVFGNYAVSFHWVAIGY